MSTVTRITFENYADYPVGTKVLFNFGAYYPDFEGTVTGVEFVPASKYFSADVRLVAEYIDADGDDVTTTITMFSTVGIGVYLLEVAEKVETKTMSPWAA